MKFDPTLVELTDEQMSNIWGAGGGSGQSGETRYNWNPFMENMWAGGINGNPGLLNRAVDNVLNANNGKYIDFGSRYSGMNETQTGAGSRINDIAQKGTALGNTGRNTINDIAQGKYLDGGGDVSYKGMQMYGPTQFAEMNGYWNPYTDAKTDVGKNDYAGLDSPYFKKQLEQGQNSIVDAYNKGTGADIKRMANMSGAFGGSAHQAMLSDAEKNLGEQLGNFTNNAQQAQYDRSANLAESDISRRMGAQQNDLARGYGGFNDFLNRFQNNQQFNKSVDSNFYQNWANQNLAADMFNAQNRSRGVDQMLQAGQLGLGADASAISNLMSAMGYGDKLQQNSQSELNDKYNRWSEDKNWERNNINWMAQLLGMGQGTTGTITQNGGYGGINPVAGILGSAAMLGSMWPQG